MNKVNRGFTLIELLVAMGIVAVLTALAAFNFNQSRIRSRDVQRKSDLSQLQKALELYRNDNNEYPVAAGYQTSLTAPVKYIKTTFADVRASEWEDYKYYPKNSNKTYFLTACLENTADSTKASLDQCEDATGVRSCACGPENSKIGVLYIITEP
jgi:prepilin-type N-terminal cleavage/methylation domain-containing protein